MLTDVFINRYQNLSLLQTYDGYPERKLANLIRQASQIIYEDIQKEIPITENTFKSAHDKLCREFGIGRLFDSNTYSNICAYFLFEQYDLFNNRHGNSDNFIKFRISLIELLLREIEVQIFEPFELIEEKRFFGLIKSNNSEEIILQKKKQKHFQICIEEFNQRMKLADFPFHYHNGYIQKQHDKLSTQQIHTPFWELLKDIKWKNVDMDIKEAIDRRDTNGKDSSLYAARALESTIKIISDEKGWTIGNEKGVANFIDNLVSKKNGKFIDTWESDFLKKYFSETRNPFAHGSGSQNPPQFNHEQITWAIENSMSWIKSLITRI